MRLELKHNFPINKDLLWNANSLGKINDFFLKIIKITDKFIGILGVGILMTETKLKQSDSYFNQIMRLLSMKKL